MQRIKNLSTRTKNNVIIEKSKEEEFMIIASQINLDFTRQYNKKMLRSSEIRVKLENALAATYMRMGCSFLDDMKNNNINLKPTNQ